VTSRQHWSAQIKFQRISPQKLRLSARDLRGARVDEALRTLAGTKSKGAVLLAKALRSALANSGAGADAHGLRVKSLWIDGGPMIKRFRPMSMGRAGQIRKRTSHIRIELGQEA